MKLEGSCHCARIRFHVEAPHPYPYNLCYCSVCRKTAGGGGYAINLGAAFDTLVIDGEEHIQVYRAESTDPDTGVRTRSLAERSFCRHCATALWVWDPRWPKLLHPFASAVNTPLPTPPERTHLMLDSRAPWTPVHRGENDQVFAEYPEESLADWHRRLGL